MEKTTNNNFPVVSASILLLSIVALLFLPAYSLLLSLILIGLALIKHALSPLEKEFLWYVLVFTGGTLVEMALVNYSGAWNYATQHVMGMPIWMPLFWGNIGITIVQLYEWVKNLRSPTRNRD